MSKHWESGPPEPDSITAAALQDRERLEQLHDAIDAIMQDIPEAPVGMDAKLDYAAAVTSLEAGISVLEDAIAREDAVIPMAWGGER